MTIVRLYKLKAAPGKAGVAADALTRLAKMLPTIEGNRGADVLRDDEDDSRFVFIQRWDSIGAHREGILSFDQPAVADLVGAVEGGIGGFDGCYASYIHQG